MKLSPDETIYWKYGFVEISATLVWTWVVMLVLIITSVLITRKLKSELRISRWQCILEMLVTGINQQIKEVGLEHPEKYIWFLGTMFLFIATSNLFILFPFYEPPTGSLSTTVALSLSVLVAVPVFGIMESGIGGYLKTYIEPTFIMLPFNIISELSRTLALAVRLFGNIMSGGVVVSIILSITPFIFPVIMNALGMLTGLVQAYIFTILATVYIAAGTNESKKTEEPIKTNK